MDTGTVQLSHREGRLGTTGGKQDTRGGGGCVSVTAGQKHRVLPGSFPVQTLWVSVTFPEALSPLQLQSALIAACPVAQRALTQLRAC